MTEDGGREQAVSVIGLGAMGSGIARTLLEAGWRVSVWNRSPDKVQPLVAQGATACTDPISALAAGGQAVVCVADYGVWMRIVEEHGLADCISGRCVIQLTGGEIDQVRAHAAFIADHGVADSSMGL